MGIRKYYYLYYAGMLFTFSAALIMSIPITYFENIRLFGYAFFSVGLTLGLLASIRYWGWLIKEIIKDDLYENFHLIFFLLLY